MPGGVAGARSIMAAPYADRAMCSGNTDVEPRSARIDQSTEVQLDLRPVPTLASGEKRGSRKFPNSQQTLGNPRLLHRNQTPTMAHINFQ